MVVQKEEGASLKPSDAVEGTGLLDNVDVVWKEVKFEMWDYNNTQKASPALKVVMGLEDGEEAIQYFSCGSADAWAPSKDGKKLVPISGAKGMAKSSNFMILMDSLVKAGYPEDKISDDCSDFENLECHMVRVKAPERKGLVQKARPDGKTYEKTNLVVDVIHKLPWEKKGAGKGKDAGTDAVAEKTSGVIMEILGDEKFMKSYSNGIPKAKLAGEVFKRMNADKDKDAMAAAQLANKDDFLKEGAWTLEKGVVSM